MPSVNGIWVFNPIISLSNLTFKNLDVKFSSNGERFKGFYIGSTYWTPLSTSGYVTYQLQYRLDKPGEDSVTVYDDGWKNSKYTTINFGETPQEVSDTLYTFLTSNAKKEKYKIYLASSNPIKLHTKGKICTEDLTIIPQMDELTVSKNGEYKPSYAGFKKVTVNVPDMLQSRINSHVNACQYLFYLYKGDNVDFISDLDTSNVTDMCSMFSGCSNLKTIPKLNTRRVTHYNYMFNGCANLTTVPALDLYGAYNLSYMFNGCKNLTEVSVINIYQDLTVGSNSWGHLLTLDCLVGLCKECVHYYTDGRTLTVGSVNLEKLSGVYVRFTDPTQTSIPRYSKGDVVICESVDDGAMTIQEYMAMKCWALA